jgi:hypothetical protein
MEWERQLVGMEWERQLTRQSVEEIREASVRGRSKNPNDVFLFIIRDKARVKENTYTLVSV